MKYDINFPNNPFAAKNLTKIKDVLGIRSPSEEMYSDSVNAVKEFVNGIRSNKEACDESLHRELHKQIAENINIRLKRELGINDDIPSAYPGSTFVIDKVIFNPPATIVFWKDRTKTVVKCKEGEEFSEWAGIALCLAKKLYGPNFHKIFKAHCSDPDKIEKSARTSVSSRGAPIDGFLPSMKEATKNATEIMMDFGKWIKDFDAK